MAKQILLLALLKGKFCQQFRIAPAFTNTSSIYVNSSRYADNLTGGGVGSIPIQSAAGTTSFVPLGTSGFVLTAGATTATWQAVSTLAAGTATNIANGLANQLVYQTAPGTTGFISTSTTGNFLQATTNGAPSWTGTASMQVGMLPTCLVLALVIFLFKVQTTPQVS